VRRSSALLSFALVSAPVLAVLGALLVGPYPASAAEVVGVLTSRLTGSVDRWPVALQAAIIEVRLPRVLMSVLVGMSLSVSGAAYQAIFRNPLVSAHILGVASGAACGAAAAILASGSRPLVHGAAFAGGALAVVLVLAVSHLYRGSSPLTMVLVGLVVGSFFSALVSLLTYAADPNQKLPAIVFWLMGSLSAASRSTLAWAAPPILAACGGLLLLRWRLNLLSLGEEEARSLGVATRRDRLIVIGCCTLATSAAVCVAGVVGWIGLVVPHFGRLLVGADNRRLVPACLSFGAVYVLLVDTLARTLTQAELPLGVLTALVGAPIFALLLARGQRWA
jgi:iron complex transport system permease protein